MSKKVLSIRYFNGGIVNQKKEGPKGSFRFAKRLDIFSDPSEATILQTPTKRSGTTVTALPKWIISGSPYDSNVYTYDSSGKFYREDVAGTWTLIGTLANSHGQGMDVFNDYIYLVCDNTIAQYGPLTGFPVLTESWKTGLNQTSEFAPLKAFKEGFVVGHGNDVAWYDGTQFIANFSSSVADTNAVKRLHLPPGIKVRSFEIVNEFIAIGVWRGTNIYDSDEGFLFFWDGIATTFNNFIPISEGACNALLTRKNQLYTVAGAKGYIEQGYQPPQIITEAPRLERGKYVEIYPGAVTNWFNQACFGYAGNTNSTSVVQGVYVYSNSDDKYPDAFNYSYSISTGTESSLTTHIGALQAVGNYLYIGWQDGVSYGVDRIGIADSPATSASYESLISDDGRAYADKQALFVKAAHLPLAVGESVQVGYKINRASTFTYGVAHSYSSSDVKPTETSLQIPSEVSDYNELEITYIISQTGGTAPTITWFGAEYLDLSEQDNF